jgi:hypothetical protein
MKDTDSAPTRTVCGTKLENGNFCQNPVKQGKGPCWRHANGFPQKVRSFAQNETKKFILTTVLSIAAVLAAFYGGTHINIAGTSGPNSPAVNGNGAVINYGAPPSRPWLAIKNPTLTNSIELGKRGFDAWVQLPLENTSDTPAVAAVGASLFFVTDHHPKAGIERAQDDLCKSIQEQMEADQILTSTIFRGTEPYPKTLAVHTDRKEVDEAIRLMTLNFLPPGSEPEISPVITSCAVYRATTGKDYYSSAYANLVSRLICKKPTNIVCNVGDMFAKNRKYNATELAFPPSFESAVRTK